MEEFSEDQVNSLIAEALSNGKDHAFGPENYLGLAETDLLEVLYKKLTERFEFDYVHNVFEDVRADIVSRKVSITLKDLHTVTKNCNKCNISTQAELPKWNVQDPDILVIVDHPNIPQQSISLMVDSFKKAGLTSDQLCLTYVNRCPVKRAYENDEIINCSPFLHQEIQLLNPRLVLCLGSIPSSVLFGTNMKIKDIRGQILWLGYWPIMTTYSPNYVVKQQSLDYSNAAIEQFENDILQARQFITKPVKKGFHHDD